MMKKKKNRFWLFIFSLWPGAGHMYMGFMKMGVSLMLGFLVLIALVNITGIGAIAAFPIVLYVYSFFHANNIGGLDDESFQAIEDEYFFGLDGIRGQQINIDDKGKRVAAVIFIVVGLYMLWNVFFGLLRDFIGWDNPILKSVYYFMRDDFPRAVIGIAIIWFGTALLRGKKMTIMETDEHKTEPVQQIEQKDGQNPGEQI